ncbi:MAG: HlyD family efflux transporter periplasmic adaptor subunit [Marinilabiliaceae bacterium]|nr:HlyD family efflux transporter periplasmic adaptor subunit [Marinilabiliaceae bacterium]
MPEINNTEIHSEEVQEIMGQIPGWIIRCGLTLIFILVFTLLIGSYFFKYPEMVSAPLKITTYNTPAPLDLKSGGQIDCMLVEDEQEVEEGQVIAVIKNTADYQNVFLLEKKLKLISEKFGWDQLVLNKKDLGSYTLGEVQQQFVMFQKNWKQFRHYLNQNRLPLKVKLLEQQINKQNELLAKQKQQLLLSEEDLELSRKSFQRDSVLFGMGDNLIAKADFERSKQAFIQKNVSYIGSEASVKSTEAGILRLKETRIETELQLDNEINQFRLALDESLQLLVSSINHWKDRYVIISPINGKITLTGYWSSNQVVKTGERLATVVPSDETKIIAKTIIPPGSFGKVEKGQKVNIKLFGFPYMEFGMLKGEITAISMVPDKEGYVAEIALTNGMTSSYSEQLKFIQEMDGTAEIITKDMRLISRFFNPLKAFFDSSL